MQKKYFYTDEAHKKGNTLLNSKWDAISNYSKLGTILLAILLLFSNNEVIAQNTFTLGDGIDNQLTTGVTPFSTDYKNSRTQYLYYGQQLLAQGAVNGNVISFAFNITELSIPSGVYPENVSIKMKLTQHVV